jgi:hypothetical protein
MVEFCLDLLSISPEFARIRHSDEKEGERTQGIAAQFLADLRRDLSETSRISPRVRGSGAISASRYCHMGSSVRSTGSAVSGVFLRFHRPCEARIDAYPVIAQ